MTKPQVDSTKKPIGIYILAILFLIAPIGNIVFTLSTSNIPDWYNPKMFIELVSSMHLFDIITSFLLILSGLLLFKAHKTAWTLSLISLTLILGLNTYRIFYPPPGFESDLSTMHLGFSVCSTFVVMIIAFYFRYPYLDRRAQWFFPTAHRYDVQSNVEIVANDIFSGVTESLSLSGARIRLKMDMGESAHKLKHVDVIFNDLRKLKLTCEVIQYDDNILRVKFKRMSRSDRELLSNWLKQLD